MGILDVSGKMIQVPTWVAIAVGVCVVITVAIYAYFHRERVETATRPLSESEVMPHIKTWFKANGHDAGDGQTYTAKTAVVLVLRVISSSTCDPLADMDTATSTASAAAFRSLPRCLQYRLIGDILWYGSARAET
jgi:hypothetical protein